ncbi:MAG: peptidoglycan-binding protein [Planctomycetes bacterium]|nr:peptidoglycan-binding protein [Planctomycetota bacterium]
MSKKRILILYCVLALMALVAGGAWVVGARIVSPAEAAARTAPPTPSPILVPVEQRVLSNEIVTRGTARFGLPQPLAIAPSTLKLNTASVITTLPIPNTQFKEGDVALTTSGRPLFILQGAVPAYRDLVPGSVGKDVRQLEEALQRMGFDPGPIDGTFDAQTSDAVAKWYEAAGFEPFRPTPEQLTNLRTLEVAHGDAAKAKLAAQSAAETAKLAVKAARMKAQHVYKTATADVAVKISDRALIVLDPRALQTARTAADANLELARAAVTSAELDGEVALQTALDAQKVADLDAQLTAEREEKLAADLDAAKRKMGVQIPLDEIVFFPSLPVRVEQVTALVGGAATGPVMSVTDNQVVIDSSLPLDVAPLVKPGMEVAIDEPAVGIKARGIVETVAPSPGTNGVDGYHFYFSVRAGESPTPLQGFSLRLTMPIKSTAGAVTAVPISALSLAANGTSRIQVSKDGGLEYVAVEPGLAADGFVEVKPLEGTLEPGQLVVVGKGNSEAGDLQP